MNRDANRRAAMQYQNMGASQEVTAAQLKERAVTMRAQSDVLVAQAAQIESQAELMAFQANDNLEMARALLAQHEPSEHPDE